MSHANDGGPAFPVSTIYSRSGMSVRDYFAAHLQVDDRLVKCVRAMDDTALQLFALHPDLEREDWITETGVLALDWHGMTEVQKVAQRLELEARAIARVRYMQADAMLAERVRVRGEEVKP